MSGTKQRLAALNLAVAFSVQFDGTFDRDDVVDVAEKFAAFLAGDSKEEPKKEAPKVGEWIEWAGGECPLPAGTKHKVRFRLGKTSKGDRPETWVWGHHLGDHDIVAYRILEANA